jgi:hypothetical protein
MEYSIYLDRYFSLKPATMDGKYITFDVLPFANNKMFIRAWDEQEVYFHDTKFDTYTLFDIIDTHDPPFLCGTNNRDLYLDVRSEMNKFKTMAFLWELHSYSRYHKLTDRTSHPDNLSSGQLKLELEDV